MSGEVVRLWSASAGAVVLIHAAAVAALILHVQWRHDFIPPPAAMAVQLAVLPAAPQIPETDIRPGPRQVESRVATKPRPVRVEPKFEPPPQIKTAVADVVVKKPEEAQPRQLITDATPAPDTTAPAAAQVKPAADLLAPAPGPTSNTHSTAEQTWEAKVLAQLERYKRYPPEAQREHQEDTVYLHFSLDRRGHVLESHIERSSGYGLLDSEVLTLIQRAAPLPKPPKEVPGDPIQLTVPVEFFVKKATP